jgi:hypothetical protein
MRVSPVLILILAAAPLAAQSAAAPADTVHVGSPSLRVDRLATRTDTMEMWTRSRRRGETLEGIVILHTELPEGFGPPLIERTETVRVEGAVVSEDRWMLDRPSLAPLSYRSREEESERISIGFYNRGARGWREGENGREEVSDTLPLPRFLAGSMDLLLGTLPLSPGAAYVLPVWDAADGAGWAAVRVAGLEDLEGSGPPIRAWRVEVEGVSSQGTYWLDRESHALVQYVGAEYRLVRVSGRARRPGAVHTSR